MYREVDMSYYLEIIGTYEQRADEVMLDAKQEASLVRAGLYPVVGAVAETHRTTEGGVIFDGVNLVTSESNTVIAFHSSAQLRELEKSGTLTLADGFRQTLLDDVALQESFVDRRQGMRR